MMIFAGVSFWDMASAMPHTISTRSVVQILSRFHLVVREDALSQNLSKLAYAVRTIFMTNLLSLSMASFPGRSRWYSCGSVQRPPFPSSETERQHQLSA